MSESTSVQWMHSCYHKTDDLAVLTVKEKHVTIDEDTQKVLRIKDVLRPIINPKRKVWITKPEYRRHRYKKESELLSKCDPFVVEDRLLLEFLKEKMELPKYKRIFQKEICNSPYIYGIDISMEALVRYKYESNMKHAVTPITIGSLDIESSVIHDDNRTNLITVICDKKIYTAALKEFMWKKIAGKKVSAGKEDMLQLIENMIEGHLAKHQKPPTNDKFLKQFKEMEIIAEVFDTEMAMYEWIFKQIHEDAPDYMFIWNLGYDVPQMIKRIEANGRDPKDFFCHPKVHPAKRYLKYYEDRRKITHIVEKWNWLHCTSLTQWLDAMALFGQVRRQKPKESSYKLDDIMSNLLGLGKVDFGNRSHYEMQSDHFLEYWVYNIFDSVLVQLGVWETQDHNSLYMLTEHSTLMDFSKQTVMLGNDYHHVLLTEGRVFAATGKDMTGPYDHMLSKVGGAVLDARNVIDIGIRCVIERPNEMTSILVFCADDDYSAIYPSWKIAAGVAKENKRATMVGLVGMPSSMIEPLFCALSDPVENAVWLGNEYFGLKNYTQMEECIRRQLENKEKESEVT